MTDRDVTKPSHIIRNQSGARGVRWYPHEVLERLAIDAAASFVTVDDLPWDLLEPEDAAKWLPELTAAQRNLNRFVSMIEAIAEGRAAVICESCSQRFYPSRSDARYCGARCRMTAHRRKGA